jgi:hypothetical protein
MSDRLQELLRQRAAIHAHLAWLDREIAAQSTRSVAALLPASSPVTLPPAAPFSLGPRDTPEIESTADTILAGYRQDSANLRTDVRKGCLLYFFVAFALVALGIGAFYLANRWILSPTD